MTMAWPRLVVGQQTDPGRDPTKQENEDSLVYQELHVGHLLLVCDGMGGHSSGREASQLAVATVVHELARAAQGADPGEALKAAVEEANRRVFTMPSAEAGGRPGSTCVAVLIHPMGTEVAHLGDSRAYLVRAGQLWPLTRDHSMVQEMVQAGLLRAEEAHGHPDSNKITRALGMAAEAQVELRSERLLQQRGDVFLLVSDGVSDVVRDTDLQAMATLTLENAQMAQLCAQVVQLANARGGPDNTTILAAYVVDPGLRPEAAQQAPRRTAAATVIETTEEILPDPRNRPGGTLPGEGGPPPTVNSPPTAQPAAPAGPLSPRPGAGATVKLALHGDATATPTPPIEILEDPNLAKKRRMMLGLVLLVVGMVTAGLSLRALLPHDEAPPPLEDAPSASAPTPRASGSK